MARSRSPVRDIPADLLPPVEAVRHFSRFYTQRLGILRERLYGSPFGLSAVRLLYELAHRNAPTAAELARDLGLDAGYVSRILAGFVRRGLVRREASAKDARQSHLHLTPRGRKAMAPLERSSQRQVAEMVAPLSTPDRRRLIDALSAGERLLGGTGPTPVSYMLRPHRPGDMGWVIGAHGALYAREFGWNIEFEAFVADIAAKFIRDFDPAWENCWIAEKDGETVGSVFVVRHSKHVAKLRMLIIDPKARGLGLGRRLVDECLEFARAKGYRRMILWTNSVLLAARQIYIDTGFEKTAEEKHRSFGVDLIGETWERDL